MSLRKKLPDAIQNAHPRTPVRGSPQSPSNYVHQWCKRLVLVLLPVLVLVLVLVLLLLLVLVLVLVLLLVLVLVLAPHPTPPNSIPSQIST